MRIFATALVLVRRVLHYVYYIHKEILFRWFPTVSACQTIAACVKLTIAREHMCVLWLLRAVMTAPWSPSNNYSQLLRIALRFGPRSGTRHPHPT